MRESNDAMTWTGLRVWLLCALFFLYEFLLRTVIGTFQGPIMNDLALSSFTFSLLSCTTYLLIYGFMQLPVGFLVDRWGLKRTLTAASLICAVAVIGFSFAHSLFVAILWRMLMGFGSSFGFVVLLVSVYEWMPRRNIALMIGLSQFIGTLGPMLAAGPLNALAEQSSISWRIVFFNLGLSGLVLSFLVLLGVDNRRQEAGAYVILQRSEPLWEFLKRLFQRSAPWAIALFSACIYGSIEYLSESEGKLFLMLKGLTSGQASYMITLSWVGYALGCPTFGWLSDFTERRKVWMILGGLASISGLSLMVFAPPLLPLMGFSFVLLGVGASGQSVAFVMMAEQFKKQHLALALALNNAIITLFTSLNAPIMGSILDAWPNGHELVLVHYQMTFSILVALSVLAFLLATTMVRETFCKSTVEFTKLSRPKMDEGASL